MPRRRKDRLLGLSGLAVVGRTVFIAAIGGTITSTVACPTMAQIAVIAVLGRGG